jgi:hypothetical protein
MLTCSGVKLDLIREAVRPATENMRSEVVSVAGIAKYFLASSDNFLVKQARNV